MSDTTPILAIDTSGPQLQLALWDGAQADICVEDLSKGHAEIIFQRIDTLLSRNNLAMAGLSRIAVTTGPGSFTGLRIGLSAAQGLALGLNIPVIGVPTLVAMSLSVDHEGSFAIAKDARRNEAYVQKFDGPGRPTSYAELISSADMQNQNFLASEKVDIAAVARFATTTNPQDYPPMPHYIRDADAKPQTKGIVAHQGAIR